MGIRIIVDPYSPSPHQIRHAGKGPYFKRREKRLARSPKNWTPYEYFRVVSDFGGELIICCPAAAEALAARYPEPL